MKMLNSLDKVAHYTLRNQKPFRLCITPMMSKIVILSGVLWGWEHRHYMSTEDFFTFKRDSLLQYTVDNKVSASAPRLTLYENLFIGQEKGVRCPH